MKAKPVTRFDPHLTPRERQVYECIWRHRRDYGCSPLLRDIGKVVRQQSGQPMRVSNVHNLVVDLVAKGWLRIGGCAGAVPTVEARAVDRLSELVEIARRAAKLEGPHGQAADVVDYIDTGSAGGEGGAGNGGPTAGYDQRTPEP